VIEKLEEKLEIKNKAAAAAAGTRKNKKQKKSHPTEQTFTEESVTTTTAAPTTPTPAPTTPATTTTTTATPLPEESSVAAQPKKTTQAAGKQPKSGAQRRGSSAPTTTTPATTTTATTTTTPSSTMSSRAYLNEEEPELGMAPGDKVAARISGEAADIDESLVILASVVRPLDRNRYEIEDEDPGDDSEPNPIRKHYKLHRSKITALPKDFQAHKIMSKGSVVLAMFPDTTTFYPATVEKVPTSANQPYYSLKFENDEEDGRTPSRKVKFNFVIPLPTQTSNK
jgi:hypothetical protein